jgi:hypothetical protein
VAAEDEGGHIFNRDVEFLGDEIAEARESSTPAMPTTLLRGRPENFCSAQTMASSGLVMQMTKALGAYLDAGADLLHDLQVDAQKIVAAHAGLARHAGGDDADIGAFDGLIVVGTRQLGVEAVDRRGLGDVERLALRNTSAMSNRTMSPSSFKPARWASVPPIIPEPINAILLRAIS